MEKTIEKQLRRYIVPNVLAMVGISCYILVDTFFISIAAGTNGITALNLVLPLYAIIYALGAMIGIGSATRYSLCKAREDLDADNYFSNSVSWTVIISLIFIALGIFFTDEILIFLGADEVILEVGSPYTQIVLCFAPFFMLNYTFTAFVRNDASPNIAMTATLMSGVFNIIFDYILMFPLGMGMAGAALATGISPAISMLICMSHFLSKRNTIRVAIKLPSLRRLIDSCSLGVVAFIGEISGGITTMAINYILLDLVGNVAVAAYGVIANVAVVGMSLFNGLSQGMQPLASEMHGKMEREAEKRIYKHSMEISILISLLLVVTTFIFAELVVDIFNSEKSIEMTAYANNGIRIYFIGFIFAAVNVVEAQFYSAIGNARASAIISILRGVVAIVVFAFVLAKLLGITGVWLAFPVAELFTLVLSKLLKRKDVF